MFFGQSIILVSAIVLAESDVFPSLLTTNATLAIVIDREYLAEDFHNIKNKIDDYLVYAKRELLRHGGMNVQLFTWSAINVKRDFTALLSITSCSNTWRLFKAAENENLLHIAISEQDCPRLPPDKAISIPIIEKGQETPQLLLDLRTTRVYQWKHIIIIYDNTISEDLLTRVIKSITKKTYKVEATGISLVDIDMHNFERVDDFKANLKAKLSGINIRKVGGNFLAIVSFELVQTMMEFAKELGFANTQNQWLYIVSNTNNKVKHFKRFKKFLQDGANVAFIYNNTVVDDTCTGNVECHIEETLTAFMKSLDQAIVEEFEIAQTVSEEEWEVIRPTKSDRKKYLLENVKHYLTAKGVCDNCTKWNIEAGETWGRVYQSEDEKSIAEILSVGTWRPSIGPVMTDALFPHVAHGFRQKNLPLVSFHNPPWQILKLDASGDIIQYSGIVFDIINELSRNLNFTYTVEAMKTSNVTANTNDSDALLSSQYNTYKIPQVVLEMVHNKSVAMGACAFTVTEDSKKIVDFTNPISIQTYSFLVARPKELSRALLFISPFRYDTWICLSITIISMGPILFYIHKASPVYEYKGIRSEGGLGTVQNCIWYMYGALLQQGGMHLPNADSARIIVGAWWLVVLVIGTTYCGNLVAYLTFPKIAVPITTLEELIARIDTVTWSYAKNTFFEAQLKESSDNTYKIIYQNAHDISNRSLMIDKIRNGKHVHIDWKIKLQYIMKQQFIENDACSFALGTDEFSDEQIALIVAPDTPYLHKINLEIKKLHQVGLIDKWLKDYLPKKDKCWKKKKSVEVNNHTVNLDDMQGSFFVLFIGFFLAVIVIGIEKIWTNKVKNKTQNDKVQPFVT